MPVLKPRILLIEDNAHRIEQFRKWLCGTEFVHIEASSGGRAMGILRKGGMDGIAGLCLDHDLDEQPMTNDDMSLSTSNLMNSIVLSVPRSVPILELELPRLTGRITNLQQGIKSAVWRKDFSVFPSLLSKLLGDC